ncbi:hypothetical protein [Pukyongiella litopenaei]|uniref:Secreted protein n=1 Tax=Pukyongiella litopenaei TaxID=2605946 RepID=A0A2S0MPN5_9RHOB|nr:hypothetical protein [Pukyongiella litopenaei]AVO37828.1 hypothetical protein C6Y53_09020 [Pukyongiella litopenaei]
MTRYRHLLPACLAAALPALSAAADPPVVEKAQVRERGGGWRFDVTLRHPDTGWEHYADGWRVLDINGVELGMRVLHHPHETEQPFTRSLDGVVLPRGVTRVQVQARCSVDGWAEPPVAVDLR